MSQTIFWGGQKKQQHVIKYVQSILYYRPIIIKSHLWNISNDIDKSVYFK